MSYALGQNVLACSTFLGHALHVPSGTRLSSGGTCPIMWDMSYVLVGHVLHSGTCPMLWWDMSYILAHVLCSGGTCPRMS